MHIHILLIYYIYTYEKSVHESKYQNKLVLLPLSQQVWKIYAEMARGSVVCGFATLKKKFQFAVAFWLVARELVFWLFGCLIAYFKFGLLFDFLRESRNYNSI